ncbi:MAG: 23S rRNA pseudouridine2605 synthase, partial [Sphingobacteriales bacterium]
MRKPSKRKFTGDFKSKEKGEDRFERKTNRAPRADREEKLEEKEKTKPQSDGDLDEHNTGAGNPETANSIRLNKYIADAGICSRRKADTLIGDGLVEVDGKITNELGTRINPSSVVRVDGKIITRQKLVYVLLNKPKDYLTTTDDPENRRTVMDLITKATTERVFPVGRLDRQTTGLLLFTNDGELAQKLMHPSHGVR